MTIQLTSNGCVTIDGTLLHAQSLSLNYAKQLVPQMTDGDISPHSIKCFSAVPTLSITTKDISTLITAAGTTASSVSTIIAYFQHCASNGVRAATHTSASFSSALLKLNSISVNQGSAATATATFHIISSDNTDPIEIATNASLPTYSALDTEILTLGECSVAATDLEGVTDWNLTLSGQVIPLQSDGVIYPKQYNLVSMSPAASITTINPNQVDSDLKITNNLGIEEGAVVLKLQDTSSGLTNATAKTFTCDAKSMSVSEPRSASQGSLTRQTYSIQIAGGRTSGITVS